MWQRASRWLLFAVVSSGFVACASKEDRPAPRGGSGSGKGGSAGEDVVGDGGFASGGDAAQAGGGSPGAGGSFDGAAGSPLGGSPGAGGDTASGGEPPIPDGPFTGPDPFPCDSDSVTAQELNVDCAPGATWGTVQELKAGANLIGITPDELTLVWSEAQGSQLYYFVADRPSASAAFGAAQSLESVNVVAVSPDGLRLAALSSDQSALIALERADRSSAFGSEAEGEFAALDDDARARGWSFSSCVFSPDDRSLFYTVGGPDSKYLLHVASRADTGAWPVGTLLEQCELEVHGGYGRYPTGVSADGQTLFFYDSWRGVTRAAWRDPETSAFTWFKDLGRWFAAQPNAACDRLYYSQPGEETTILSASDE